MKALIVATTAVVVAVVGALTSAYAQQDEVGGIVGYRMALMKAQGAHAKSLQLILTDQTQLIGQAAAHATAIQATAPMIPDLFPEGVTHEKSTAAPKIWEDPDGFAAAAKKLEELAGGVVAAAESGDAQATLAAFGAMGKEGCGGCHESYRIKRQ